MSFAIKVAKELHIPEVQFWTASACSFMAYLHFGELVRRGIIPFKDEKFLSDGTLDTTIDWIPGMKHVRLRDIPSFIRTTNVLDNVMFDFMGSEAENCLTAPAIIFNTFQELEHEVLDAIAAKFPKLYNIGPLSSLAKHAPETKLKSLGASLWKEDSNCLQWLNQWQHKSVLYVNYGSVTVMSKEHLNEFAWGLANSKHPFLWIVRPDVVVGESTSLAEEFLNEIEGRGYLTSWCPQDQVLAHPSVGVFLTHAGWNSITEAISEGVPIICWPFFADQQTNCRYASENWGIGMEVDHEVNRDEVSLMVNEMLVGENGKQKSQKAYEWKKRALEAIDVGGSSYNDFHRLLKELLNHHGLETLEH